MSVGYGPEDHGGHGGGGGSNNAMWEYMFGYCKEVGGAARGMTRIFSFLVNGIFDSGGWGGHDSHGH